MIKMIGGGPPWSDRDLTRWQLVEDPGLVELSRMGVRQAASSDEPSRLPEGVAQPASSLRVQNVSAQRVCQRGTRCAERDLRRDLPASCRRHALLCSAMHEDGTNGTPRVPHAVAIMPKQLFWYAGRYPIRSWLSATPSLDTPAARPRPVQSNPSREDQSATLEVESLGQPDSL